MQRDAVSLEESLKARQLRVGLLGHHGNLNLGDEITFQAAIDNLRRRVPDVEIVCFSNNPDDTLERHGVPTYPVTRSAGRNRSPTQQVALDQAKRDQGERAGPATVRDFVKRIPGMRPSANLVRKLMAMPGILLDEVRFIRKSRRRLQNIDLLVVTGSNQFLDSFGGTWLFPYSMIKWALLARSTHTRFAVLSVGAGPLYSWLSRFFVRVALRQAAYASFRDESSRRLVARWWCGKSAQVYPDLAFSLRIEGTTGSPERGATHQTTVAINPMPVKDKRYWYFADDDGYRQYVTSLVDLCDWLTTSGHPWFMYATQPKDMNVMLDVVHDLQERGFDRADLQSRLHAPGTVNELLSLLTTADLLVATRFHGAAMAVLLGRPVLGICYEPKTFDLLAPTPLGDLAIAIEDVSGRELIDRVTKIDKELDRYGGHLKALVADYRADLDRQYEALLDVVLHPASRSRGQELRMDGSEPTRS